MENSLNEASTWDGFAIDCRRRIDAFADTMRRLSAGASIWGYGAAGKATMWVNVCEMDYLEALVDASPLRFGKLMPGTHTPIVSPEEFGRHQPDYVFVSAWNYLDAIRANEPEYAGLLDCPVTGDAHRVISGCSADHIALVSLSRAYLEPSHADAMERGAHEGGHVPPELIAEAKFGLFAHHRPGRRPGQSDRLASGEHDLEGHLRTD